MVIAGLVPVNSYPMQLVMVLLGVVILGFGVALSVVLSLALFGGAVAGVREGTLIAALGTGLAVKFFTARLKTPLDRVLSR